MMQYMIGAEAGISLANWQLGDSAVHRAYSFQKWFRQYRSAGRT